MHSKAALVMAPGSSVPCTRTHRISQSETPERLCDKLKHAVRLAPRNHSHAAVSDAGDAGAYAVAVVAGGGRWCRGGRCSGLLGGR
jgi:hypothetical protein